MGISDEEGLARAFKDKIIPLLQEYFYGDYGKIGLVLGEGFIAIDTDNKDSNKLFADFNYDDASELIKPIYTLKDINKANIIEALDSLGI